MSDEVNSEPKLTVINVKGVDAELWRDARQSAQNNDQTAGEWLNEVIRMRLQMEKEGRLEPLLSSPSDANPAAVPRLRPEEVEALSRSLHLAAQASGQPVSRKAAAHVSALVIQHSRAAQGLPEQARPKPPKRTLHLGLATLPASKIPREIG